MFGKFKQKPRDLDPNQSQGRRFDVITFLLACLLAAIVLAAVGYGILNSSQFAATVPQPPNGLGIATKTDTP